jgi:hypothetical protein
VMGAPDVGRKEVMTPPDRIACRILGFPKPHAEKRSHQ